MKVELPQNFRCFVLKVLLTLTIFVQYTCMKVYTCNLIYIIGSLEICTCKCTIEQREKKSLTIYWNYETTAIKKSIY